ncbi:aminoglycoside phosphotransferase family protein [Alcaligenaceae bacterium]|nr:aminoglycoside phosphotransferase family protein [Alcaligenaceae bacterium]
MHCGGEAPASGPEFFNTAQRPDPKLLDFLLAQGLAARDTPAAWTALTGGVSSDIWRVALPERTLCVKCALPRLKVAQDWQAPTSRNAYEWAWLNFAAAHAPRAVPEPIAHDPELGAFAMEYLDGGTHPVWKSQLLAGHVDERVAPAVAALLGTLHSASTRDPAIAECFQNDDIFHQIRLEPYLIATAQAHPDLSSVLHDLADTTLNTHLALVHGDISPKNILVGPESPVFLDAECAWFGDPAFDVAFCLNHLLLKCLVRRDKRHDYLQAFMAFRQAYLQQVDWEAPQALERRAAKLLPALFLARVDGKSTVEYLTRESDRDAVRHVARPMILRPPATLAEIAQVWGGALAG